MDHQFLNNNIKKMGKNFKLLRDQMSKHISGFVSNKNQHFFLPFGFCILGGYMFGQLYGVIIDIIYTFKPVACPIYFNV